MASIRQLAHAPIVEALIDFRLQVPEGTTVERFEEALKREDLDYYKKAPIVRSQVGFTINPQGNAVTQSMSGESTIVGVRMHSADERYVAQWTLGSFTLSRLEPYESWESLMTESQRLWAVYRDCVNPSRIDRAATRYINNLRLPLKQGERFDRFLKGFPTLPEDYPQQISSFLQRFVLRDDISGSTAVVTQALDAVTADGRVPVILDIDVFREVKFLPDDQDVWNCLADLRATKNRLFFGALTEKAVELYA